MNQILETMKSKTKFRKVYKIQLIISVVILTFLVIFCTYYIISLNSKENLSNSILSSYSIYRLYSNLDNSKNLNDNNIFGIIKIPKINIEYSVFSNLTEEQLKVSPCKFFGENLENFGNICIAGHNYDNSLFFSNIKLLKQNDEIYIYDNFDNKYIYKVFANYEVEQNDLSPIFNYDKNTKELTLITCNNLNGKRIVIKAKRL